SPSLPSNLALWTPLVSRSNCACSSARPSAALKDKPAAKKSKQSSAPRVVPLALIRLPFPLQHALQHLAPLFGLPDLIGVLVLIEFEKLDRKSTRLNSSHEWISYAV